jgi:hypothetical protein
MHVTKPQKYSNFLSNHPKARGKGKRNDEYDLVSMATRFNISLSFRKKLIFLRKKAQTGPF